MTTYFIDKDGKLYGTGANDKGVLGIENISELNMPRMIIKNIDTIADDSKPFSPVNNCYALDKDKNVWSWGGTANNALGRAVYNVGADGRWEFIYSDSNPAKIENLKNIKLIACDKRRGIAYDSSGNVWMWGGTKAGSTVKASIMYNEKGIVDINTGSPDWILKSNGTVYELMYDEVNSKYKMVQIDGLTDIIAIENHKALKKDGTVYTVKYDYSGSREKEPIVMPEMSNVRQIASCYDITLIIKNDGTLWSWKYDNGLEGIGAYKQFDEYEMEYPFIEAIQISNLTFESVDVGYGYAILKGTDGSYYGFGSGYNGQFGEGFEMGYISKPYELNHENWKSEK